MMKRMIGGCATLLCFTVFAQEVSRRRDVDFASLKASCREVEAVKGEEPSLVPAGDWKLVWNDEFNGTELDKSKWIFRTNFYGRVMKGYTDKGAELDGKGRLRLKLVLEDGTIKASQLQTGTNYHDAPRNLEPNPWGQAPIWGVGEQPKPTFMHRYGYWEIRCKFQKLPGWWSAFWIQSPSIGMAPNARYAGVEVDVMENFHRDGRTTSGSIYGGYGKGYRNGDDRIDYKVDPDCWHRFGLLWTPTNYVYYCDGREMARSSKMVSQVEQFLIVSCEVKGYREGKMDKCCEEIRKAAIRPDGTIIDDAFEVDYVRVFDTGFGRMSEAWSDDVDLATANGRLAISFPIWALYDMLPGGNFADPDRTMVELKAHGFNAIRFDDGAGLWRKFLQRLLLPTAPII